MESITSRATRVPSFLPLKNFSFRNRSVSVCALHSSLEDAYFFSLASKFSTKNRLSSCCSSARMFAEGLILPFAYARLRDSVRPATVAYDLTSTPYKRNCASHHSFTCFPRAFLRGNSHFLRSGTEALAWPLKVRPLGEYSNGGEAMCFRTIGCRAGNGSMTTSKKKLQYELTQVHFLYRSLGTAVYNAQLLIQFRRAQFTANPLQEADFTRIKGKRLLAGLAVREACPMRKTRIQAHRRMCVQTSSLALCESISRNICLHAQCVFSTGEHTLQQITSNRRSLQNFSERLLTSWQ